MWASKIQLYSWKCKRSFNCSFLFRKAHAVLKEMIILTITLEAFRSWKTCFRELVFLLLPLPVPVFIGWGSFSFPPPPSLNTSWTFWPLLWIPYPESPKLSLWVTKPLVFCHQPIIISHFWHTRPTHPSYATLVLHTTKLLIWPVSKSHLCLLSALWLWNFLNFSESPFSHCKMGILWRLLHRWGLREIMHIKHLKSANLACSMSLLSYFRAPKKSGMSFRMSSEAPCLCP